MFEAHPNLAVPDRSTELWRYLDLSKFLFLLERSALWFSRLDTLGDPYEGLPPRSVVDDMWASATNSPDGERAKRLETARHNTGAFAMGQQIVAVSCWHASVEESSAMWSLYARLGEGIAIRTTVGRVESSFVGSEQPKIHGSFVRYVDFATHQPTHPLNLLDWATLKRTSFSHEREFRAIVVGKTGPLRAGVAVPVDLNTLIAEIRISPNAARWCVQLVRDLCARYGLEAEVGQSDLLKHPAYMDPAARLAGAS